MKKWAAEYVREPLGIPDCLSLIRLLRGEERTLRAVHERCAAKPIDIGKTLELNNFKKLLADWQVPHFRYFYTKIDSV